MTEIAPPPETSSEARAPLPEAPASLVPEALPEPAWIEAEAEALALVETLDETMQAQWQKWMETLATACSTTARRGSSGRRPRRRPSYGVGLRPTDRPWPKR